MPCSLPQFFAALDRFADRIPLADLRKALENLDIDLDDVRNFMHFGRDTYKRNLVHSGPGYQALVLCWRNGQRSPIHDHRGSNCGVRILSGVATETVFERNDNGLVYATFSREMTEGSICANSDDDIHQMSNLQPGSADLVTLHIYSPPLLHMGTYSLTSPLVKEFFDPVFAFADGDGI